VPRLMALALGSAVALSGVLLVANHEFGSTGPDVRLESEAPPSAAAQDTTGAAESTSPAAPSATDLSGVPVQVVIPHPTRNHPDGVTAPVTADPLMANGDLFVPEDPTVLSWASQDAPPGAPYGTAIITGHVNYAGVTGAFSDLAQLAAEGAGSTFTVVLADGRQLTYQIAGGAEYDKDQLAADPDLRRQIYDQDSAFGTGAGSGRLVLVSCGGAFDHSTGNYEDNVFVFAMPVG
jgi:hypothetical protein